MGRSVRIIREGKPPEEQEYEVTCQYCKTIAKSCAILHAELCKEGFNREEATRIVIAMAGKRKGN